MKTSNNTSRNVVVVSGGFDPLHIGHILYFEAAKKMGDVLCVAINSDQWLKNKKGKNFMSFVDRSAIIKSLKMVDEVIDFNDSDGSAKNAIYKIRAMYPKSKIIFANGGDRTQDNIPEMNVSIDNVEFVFGVGGERKDNSSSFILAHWEDWVISNYKQKNKENDANYYEERPWGHFEILAESDLFKIKKITVNPSHKLSYQYHYHRDENWVIVSGTASVIVNEQNYTLVTGESIFIKRLEYHRVINNSVEPLIFIEVQTGDSFDENDIVRIDDAYNRY